jgi:hypothetical protein
VIYRAVRYLCKRCSDEVATISRNTDYIDANTCCWTLRATVGQAAPHDDLPDDAPAHVREMWRQMLKEVKVVELDYQIVGFGFTSPEVSRSSKKWEVAAFCRRCGPVTPISSTDARRSLAEALNPTREQPDRSMIRDYEQEFACRLVVVNDVIFPDSVTLFEELVCDASPEEDLHLILNSPGGDGETAVRLARQAQSRCKEFVVIVPDQAKSAATLLCMGAHRVLMGPTSDLGPVDPQFRVEGIDGLVSAKDIIAAVRSAEEAVQERPETYPLHASLLSNVTALMVQQARSAMERADQVAVQALRSNPTRSLEDAQNLWEHLKDPLAIQPADHSAVFDADDATAAAARTEVGTWRAPVAADLAAVGKVCGVGASCVRRPIRVARDAFRLVDADGATNATPDARKEPATEPPGRRTHNITRTGRLAAEILPAPGNVRCQYRTDVRPTYRRRLSRHR